MGLRFEVHRALGPGLLESAYEACMVYELAERRLVTERQKALPITYKGVKIDCGYRVDLLVERQVVVELKAERGGLCVLCGESRPGRGKDSG